MAKFTWDKNKTDDSIFNNGVNLGGLTGIRSEQLQTAIESVSEELGIKFDFRVIAGRHFVLCSKEDLEKIPEGVDVCTKIVEELNK